MRLLFLKPALVWPRTSGHDVYCYYMMRALAEEGAEVSLATIEPTDARAVEGIRLANCWQLDKNMTGGANGAASLTYLQERFRSFWGIEKGHVESVRRLASEWRADVVIAFGLPALPFLGGVDSAVRVWAMADEWIYHHLSLVRPLELETWQHVKAAVIKGLYERAYSSLVDRAWAVSDTDVRAGRWLAGMKVVDLLPNGVDADFYRPLDERVAPRTAVFWGRLDFEPNVDALTWFCTKVWPDLRREVPDARFTIIGYQPTPPVERLAELPGVTLMPDVEDLRAMVCQHALVALPMINGGGIKNKLLEAAAMGRPIVCTPRAAMDLRSSGQLPFLLVREPREWVTGLLSLWNDEGRRHELGRQAREWVREYYSWAAPARNALKALQQSIDARHVLS
jgi:glycosyltransferase involved in cell wall biosynthesis